MALSPLPCLQRKLFVFWYASHILHKRNFLQQGTNSRIWSKQLCAVQQHVAFLLTFEASPEFHELCLLLLCQPSWVGGWRCGHGGSGVWQAWLQNSCKLWVCRGCTSGKCSDQSCTSGPCSHRASLLGRWITLLCELISTNFLQWKFDSLALFCQLGEAC